MAMGGLNQVDMAFSGIRMELHTGKKKKGPNGETTRVVLDGSIRGRAQPGRMMAIMGPSGAVGLLVARWLAFWMSHWVFFFSLTYRYAAYFVLVVFLVDIPCTSGQIHCPSCLGGTHKGKFQNFHLGGRTIYQW